MLGYSLPRLTQYDIAYGCELYEIKKLGDIPETLIFKSKLNSFICIDFLTLCYLVVFFKIRYLQKGSTVKYHCIFIHGYVIHRHFTATF
ncbi:protein of unknown function, might belong to Protein/domain typically associated with flavoprotein oxygenase, DIM6/NTAB family protein [Moritella yayanosii]|uniref:Uncharacterized protein n=1 Tax=Moritella yayanosii TaxID=69539 RepID=A0A330LN39_9GAMM|nr:protein of unknown function, might belong to Protein/domain typically associated with flavoprotein oxygenase, DIM6/NTAB family protein [Moritella yayanosii]